MELIQPQWPVQEHICSFVTSRGGGFSAVPYSSFNLGRHVGDDTVAVSANRLRLRNLLSQDRPNTQLAFHWLDQVHSVDVLELTSSRKKSAFACRADASITREANQVCIVTTADCLPLLFCNKNGTQVAAVHAGWRGLADGIITNTILRFAAPPSELLCYIGPAISQAAFEVGEDVLVAFKSAQKTRQFSEDLSSSFLAAGSNKYMADIYRIAKAELLGAGVARIYGGERCTFTEADTFFSYRRDGVTGRMATGIWIDR